jgi:hypothetical protein
MKYLQSVTRLASLLCYYPHMLNLRILPEKKIWSILTHNFFSTSNNKFTIDNHRYIVSWENYYRRYIKVNIRRLNLI